MKLDIGIRRPGTDGWTTLDLHPGADICAPMWEVPSSLEAIRATHCLEHVPTAMVAPTLAEWHRVIQPGGWLVVEVPDLAWCCREWLEGDRDVDVIFGSQEDEGMVHRTGFTASGLTVAVLDAGFRDITADLIDSHGVQSIWLRAVRP